MNYCDHCPKRPTCDMAKIANPLNRASALYHGCPADDIENSPSFLDAIQAEDAFFDNIAKRLDAQSEEQKTNRKEAGPIISQFDPEKII